MDGMIRVNPYMAEKSQCDKFIYKSDVTTTVLKAKPLDCQILEHFDDVT
jgi:hypothetical protein